MSPRRSLEVLALLAVLVGGCLPPCTNRVGYESRSPDGMYKAVVFERECGGDAEPNTNISVLPADADLPDEGGNVFFGQMQYIHATVDASVAVRWTGPRQLEIEHNAGAMIFKMERRVGEVGVVYRPR